MSLGVLQHYTLQRDDQGGANSRLRLHHHEDVAADIYTRPCDSGLPRAVQEHLQRDHEHLQGDTADLFHVDNRGQFCNDCAGR